MRTIKVQLSTRGIEKAIKELKDYEKEIAEKTRRLVETLQAEGISVASAALVNIRGDSTNAGIVKYDVNANGDIVSAIIALEGKDALFVEFGAGIVFNPVEHPWAGKLGYGPGTYPSEHPPNKGIFPGYWYYGGGKLSVGTEAAMPIYKASENARNTAIQRAMEIFRS